MARRRRKLIVVSNRGPVTYARDEDGNRVARRGGGGLVTALRSLVAHHDVTWIASAMTDEDRAVAEEAGGERDRGDRARRLAVPAAARRARPGRLRLVLQRRLEPDAVVPPALPLGRSRTRRTSTRGSTTPGTTGYVAGERERSPTRSLDELDAEPDAAVFFHDYHLYLAPRLVRERAPGRAARRTSSTSRGREPDYWHVLPEPIRRAIHDGLLANDVVGFHTDRWRRNFLRSSRGHRSAPSATSTRASCSYDGRRSLVDRAPDLGRPGRVRRARGERGGARAGGASSWRAGPSTSSCASTGPTRRRTSSAASAPSSSTSTRTRRCTAASACSRCSTRRGRTSPSTPSTSARSSARRGRSTTASSASGWVPIDLRIEDNFPRSVAAYKQYDVLLVNAIFDGLNLVAKEAPLVNERDGVLILSENAGAHEELGDVGADREPVRRRRAGARRSTRRSSMGRGERRARLEAIRAARARARRRRPGCETQLDGPRPGLRSLAEARRR